MTGLAVLSLPADELASPLMISDVVVISHDPVLEKLSDAMFVAGSLRL